MATDCDFMARAAFEPGAMEIFLKNPEAIFEIGHFTPHDVISLYDEVDLEKSNGLLQEGKVVLITGAGRGIGKATAIMFAKAKAKAIGICARTLAELHQTEHEIKKVNPETIVYSQAIDITCGYEVRSFFVGFVEKVGTIDIAISNAGSNHAIGLISQTNTEEWWYEQAVNLKGPFLIAKYFQQSLNGSQGTFINVSTLSALATVPGQSSYCCSKLAALRLTENLHIEAPNLRCFSLHPGAVDTRLARDVAEEVGMAPEWKWTDPALVAGTILWLTTSHAEFLRGRFVCANWRMDELQEMKETIVSQNMLKTAFTAKLGLS